MNSYQPKPFYIPLERRRFLKALAVASAGFMMPGYLAEALTVTPELTEGPYYPLTKNMPLDDDNDLIYLNDSTTAASGLVTYLTGRVLDRSGNPIKDALVETWHADNGGNYIYSDDLVRNPTCDANFQGFGQFVTGSAGGYLFRTIKAGLYDGRARHFHLAVTLPGQTTRHTTQTFWNETAYGPDGQPWATQNSDDMIFNSLTAEQKAAVNLSYTAIPHTGAVAATFDLVMGVTVPTLLIHTEG